MRPSFNPELEIAHQDGKEWKFGAIQTDLALIPLAERIAYLPAGVLQFTQLMDSSGCASRAPLNILEAKFTYFYTHGMHPDLKRWLLNNNYVKNDRVLFDDNFIEILSGTTKTGNSLKAPIEAIRKNGLIPKTLSMDGLTWEEYMNPSRITPSMTKLGAEFLRRFTINYEQVVEKPEALEEDFLSIAGHAWPEPVNGIYMKTAGDFNHAFAGINSNIDIFDNYVPFIKRLAKDYIFFQWGYSLSITFQNPYPDEQIALFEVLKKNGLLAFFAEAIRRLLTSETPVANELFTPNYPTEQPMPTEPTDPLKDPLTARHAIRVLCDENGLSVSDKNIICAVIQAESGFKNTAKNENKDASGRVTSTDYGLVQCNDYFHIGQGKTFPSVSYVLENPKKMVEWMIRQYKKGNIGWWSAYKNGSFKKYL
jgi:hypothetical protein